jgi:hypothetical protein
MGNELTVCFSSNKKKKDLEDKRDKPLKPSIDHVISKETDEP